MIEQLYYALSMATVVIGAIILMLLSHSKITLSRLNLIAVSFLSISLILQFFSVW